ncbi:MAG: NAD(P)/FAD-dependent oxidoreductase [Ilumatobacteraceae bacterium]
MGGRRSPAAEILKYMGEVIEENDLDRHIRYGHRIAEASWSSDDARWTVRGVRTDAAGNEEPFTVTANFFWACQGYYRHDEGYTPEWPGMADFGGQVIHPQRWPEDTDLTGKQVVVIGSGATAATLVPNIAGDCAHVTMIQRSPTYFFPGRNADELADMLRPLDLPPEWTHEIVRRKRLHDGRTITKMALEYPDLVATELINGVKALLPEGYDMTHFTPRYKPWRQRIAFVPDGDLFQGISDGLASVVTDEIDHWDATGIQLKSGTHLDADVIITATGFNMNVMGDIGFEVDGKAVDFADTVTYRGTMFTGVPNVAWVMGYFRASWTLRADILADFVCRLLGHMDELGVKSATPQLRDEDADMEILSWSDADEFNPGYLLRAADQLPRRGTKPQWEHSQDYWTEKDTFATADLDDGCLVYR